MKMRYRVGWTDWRGIIGSMAEKRLSRDQMFMEIAHVVAKRGTCPRAKVGAILVTRENNIVSIGYNGAPQGKPHCEDVGCQIVNDHCIKSLHAEHNALRPWVIGSGPYRMYVTHKPCALCTQKIISSGVVEKVIFDIPYRQENELDQWEEGGVTFERFIYDGRERSIQGQVGKDIDPPDDGS